MSTITAPMTMRVGARFYPVASITEASRMFCAARNKAGTGASETPTPFLFDASGKQVGYISYNGRAWAGEPKDWQSGMQPLCEAVQCSSLRPSVKESGT